MVHVFRGGGSSPSMLYTIYTLYTELCAGTPRVVLISALKQRKSIDLKACLQIIKQTKFGLVLDYRGKML